MKTTKSGRLLTTIPIFSWWLSDMIEKRQRRKRAKSCSDAIDNLERLYRLKERGAISEEDFHELKEKLKEQI